MARNHATQVYLTNPESLTALLQHNYSLIRSVVFAPNFNVEDEHVAQLVTAMGPQIRKLRLGSSSTGDGMKLTDASVKRIVESCPNLEELELYSCVKITNSPFLDILSGLPDLRVLHCTGNARRPGNLTNKALDPLLKENALPKLQRLCITDQPRVSFDKVQKLLKTRKHMEVLAGSSTNDIHPWACGMHDQTGRSYGDSIYGNAGW